MSRGTIWGLAFLLFVIGSLSVMFSFVDLTPTDYSPQSTITQNNDEQPSNLDQIRGVREDNLRASDPRVDNPFIIGGVIVIISAIGVAFIAATRKREEIYK
jgi:hypothetical protein